MGLYSWIDCVTGDPIARYDKEVRLLVPKEFGGGCVRGTYDGYGSVGGTAVLRCVAEWNREFLREHPEFYLDAIYLGNWKWGKGPAEGALWYESYVNGREPDKDFLYDVGCELASTDVNSCRLRFPAKLTTESKFSDGRPVTYEDCPWSLKDPFQSYDNHASKKEKALFDKWRKAVEAAVRASGIGSCPVPKMARPT